MAHLHVKQLRSGEGWILTNPSNTGPESVPEHLPELLVGVVALVTRLTASTSTAAPSRSTMGHGGSPDW